ncbi:hypothetical protein [Actinoplanes solisilvae]|uniref:hypothetical protein n=1 Tax=Actinoplanes solisilvae TaxID=2486853 RepID=UPI000FD7AA97|nr:hypothetical protein [Actinoplanes solisilvae]
MRIAEQRINRYLGIFDPADAAACLSCRRRAEADQGPPVVARATIGRETVTTLDRVVPDP